MRLFFFLFCISCNIIAIAQPTITPVLFPQYVQGVGSGNPPDDRKVPFVCRMQVNGLTANATYRYYSLFGTAPTGNTGNGAYIIANQTGSFTRITSPTLAIAGRYGTFTTDGSGNASEWFIVEPSSATAFTPGVQLYWRIFLNNGNNGTAVLTRITAKDPVTVINWGAGPTQGSAIRGTASPIFSAKNFLFLYDNEAGTGRPVAGAVIENDGAQQRSALNADPTNEGYAPFYGDQVDGVDKNWGTIIPNTLPNGIKNISQYDLATTQKIYTLTKSDGVFPTLPSGTVSTVNPTNGITPIVINGAEFALPVKLLGFSGRHYDAEKVELSWITASEQNFSNFQVQFSEGGSSFRDIGTVKAKGSNSNYVFLHTTDATANYYRLKIVDKGGESTVSKVILLQKNGSNSVSIFPVPASSILSVSHGAATENAQVEIIGMNGNRIKMIQLPKGSIVNQIDVSTLVAGNYVLIFKNGNTINRLNFSKL